MKTHPARLIGTGLATVLLLSNAARGDLLYFKAGGEVQLPCTRSGTAVVLDAPSGRLAFEAADFRAIVAEPEPVSGWPARLAGARKGGGSDRLAAAWWAFENGLTADAVATLREAHALEPAHEPTATLVRTLDAVGPPLEDPETGNLDRSLGGAFRTARSPHFLLRHQLDEAAARERLDLLEAVYTSYYLTFSAQGIALRPPARRLLAIVYARKVDYAEFLRREHAGALVNTQGYFHPSRNIMVAFDASDRAEQRSRRAELEARGAELARLRRLMDDRREPAQGAARARLAAEERDAARRGLLLDLERRSIDLGIAAHETVHQLAANSGLSPRFDSLPTWLHEGLAAQFEVIRGGRWAGVGRAHDLRLPDWREIRPAPRLAPLVRDEGFAQGYRKDLYAEAWALVYFLRKRHPEEFTRFLDLLRAPGPDRNRTARLVDLFRTSFGSDWPALETEWHRFMRSVSTPLESGSPHRAEPPR